jgi:hypothetical protein
VSREPPRDDCLDAAFLETVLPLSSALRRRFSCMMGRDRCGRGISTGSLEVAGRDRDLFSSQVANGLSRT